MSEEYKKVELDNIGLTLPISNLRSPTNNHRLPITDPHVSIIILNWHGWKATFLGKAFTEKLLRNDRVLRIFLSDNGTGDTKQNIKEI